MATRHREMPDQKHTRRSACHAPAVGEALPPCVAGSDLVRPGTRARRWKGHRYPHPQGPVGGRAGMSMILPMSSKIFTIFEGTSEIRRMLIGRTVTGLDVR